jgi:hypothetical protein
MLAKGFMSQISNYEGVVLGKTEKLFLYLISLEPTSVYKISIGLKGGRIIIDDMILTTGIQKMAYKNVHKRVKRLQKMGLIQELEGNFERNAKMYELTSDGLFERLLDPFPILPDIVNLYGKSPIIETLVYQFFKVETISRFESIPLAQLRLYLRKCCQTILSTLDIHRYESEKIREWRQSNSKDHLDLLDSYLDESIKKEAQKFVFEIVNMSKSENPYQPDPNLNIFPRQALLEDNLFLSLLQEIKNDFDHGCKNFL